jgi:predicted AlkP superfamily phosphohydrolase/phosphomutase
VAGPPHRTLVIGLELGDGRLIDRWSREGHLPVFASLQRSGTWSWLETVADVLHVAAWPSIYTGSSPGQHGVYFTFQPAPGLQGYQRFHEGLYGRPTFWRMLSEAGCRCTVFDAPYTHPEPGFSGIQVFDWGTWAHYLKPMSTPANTLVELRRACGDYPIGLEANDIGFMPIAPEDMQKRILPAIEAKAKAAAWLMDRAPWDLFFTVFDETHPAAHYCWSSADGAAGASAPQERLRDIYRAIDRATGALIEEAGPDATVLVVSGDGVGPNHTGWYLLPEVLSRLGLFASSETGQGAPQRDVDAGPQKRDPIKALRDLLPKDFRKGLARRLPTALRDRLARRVDTAAIDWSNTRAYCLPTDLEGYIRINLKGREPEGIVREGAEYEAVCRELVADLEELVDPATGRRAVSRVLRSDQAFPGPRRPWLPDLVVVWSSESAIGELASPKIGTVSLRSPDPRPGTHVAPGFMLARGPGIAPGARLESGHILDVAPTILARHGVTPPAHMEGRAWRELVIA